MDSLVQNVAKIALIQEELEFKDCFLKYCERNKVAKPSKALSLQTDPSKLKINADILKLADWEAVFLALQKENLLKDLAICSWKRKKEWPNIVAEEVTTKFAASAFKGPTIYTRYVLEKLMVSVIKSLIRKESLCENLHLELPLSPRYCLLISQGIAASSSLHQLSLSGSCIGDEGCVYICDAMRAMPNIRLLDLSECNLSPKSVDKIVDLIRSHGLILSTVAWESSFRYRAPQNEVSLGLSRLTLNKNPEIGDEGAEKLAACLVDDISLRAVDLQRCKITTKGAINMLGMLGRNRNLKILDLRENKISVYVMHSVKKTLLSAERAAQSKATGQSVEWLPLSSASPSGKENC